MKKQTTSKKANPVTAAGTKKYQHKKPSAVPCSPHIKYTFVADGVQTKAELETIRLFFMDQRVAVEKSIKSASQRLAEYAVMGNMEMAQVQYKQIEALSVQVQELFLQEGIVSTEISKRDPDSE